MVTDYMNSGGNVLYIAGYPDKERANLTAILKEYGLTQENGLAADTKSYYQNKPYYIFPTMSGGSQITSGIDSKSTALLLQSAAFSRTEALPDNSALNVLADSLSSLGMKNCVSYKVTEEELSDYGLDHPEAVISYTYEVDGDKE